jgi:hypothetical protein
LAKGIAKVREKINHRGSMAEEDVKRYIREKLQEIAVLACTLVADTILLSVWLVVENSLERFLVPRFPVGTPVAVVALWIFRVLFLVSTLIPCASKVYKHVSIGFLRDRAAIRKVKEEGHMEAMAAVVRIEETVNKGAMISAGEVDKQMIAKVPVSVVIEKEVSEAAVPVIEVAADHE